MKKVPLLQTLAEEEYEDQKRLETEILEATIAFLDRESARYEAESAGLYPDAVESDLTSMPDDSYLPPPKGVFGAELPSLAARLARLLGELEQARQLAIALGKAMAVARTTSEQIKMNELIAEQALYEERYFFTNGAVLRA